MLTEQAIDAINGPAKGPPLGCMHGKPGGHGKPPAGRGSGGGRFGKNGGKNFGNGRKPSGPVEVSGGRPRILLARMLQQKPPGGRGPSPGSAPGRSTGGVDIKTRM